jgi:hypothetical protein
MIQQEDLIPKRHYAIQDVPPPANTDHTQVHDIKTAVRWIRAQARARHSVVSLQQSRLR